MFRIIFLSLFLLFNASQASAYDGSFPFEGVEDVLREELIEKGAGEDVTLDNVFVSPLGSAESYSLDTARSKFGNRQLVMERLDVFDSSSRFQAVLKEDSADFSSADEKISGLEVRGKYIEVVKVPVLRRGFDSGEVVSKEDIKWIDMPKRRVKLNIITDTGQIIGKTPRRMIQEEEMIRDRDLVKPHLVKKGNPVTMVYNSPGIDLRTVGYAAEDGAMGEMVDVKNADSDLVIPAKVVGRNLVTANFNNYLNQQKKLVLK